MKRILTALSFLMFGCSSASLLTFINNVGIDLLHTDNQDFLKMSGIEKDSGSIIKMSFDKIITLIFLLKNILIIYLLVLFISV